MESYKLDENDINASHPLANILPEPIQFKVGTDTPMLDSVTIDLLIKERVTKRERTKPYYHFKKVIEDFPVPTEIKLNFIQRSRYYNIAVNLTYKQIAKALFRKYTRLLLKKNDSKLGESDHRESSAHDAVHQFVPILAPRDAIGNEVIAMREALRQLRYNSEVYVETFHPEMLQECRKFTEYKNCTDNDVVVYHFASYSPLADFFQSLDAKKILVYHNVTPYKSFIGINDRAFESSKNAREQLYELRNCVDLTIAHSEYSKMELEEIGFRNVVVAPVFLNFDKYSAKLNENLHSRHSNSVNILYVGRIAPHKKIEDLLKIFAYYHNCINNDSKLFVVGSAIGMERYYIWLRRLVRKSKLRNVHFVKNASDQDLATYFNLADLYVSMSEHEGFCIPLVESMYFGVPVVAYDCSAIPDTLGNAGIRVKEKKFEEIAEMLDAVLSDNDLRNEVIRKQNERLNEIRQHNIQDVFTRYVREVC